MKTDIQIAQEATMLPIKDVAANYGITEDDLELYGKYKAKFSDEFMNSLDDKPNGKLLQQERERQQQVLVLHKH